MNKEKHTKLNERLLSAIGLLVLLLTFGHVYADKNKQASDGLALANIPVQNDKRITLSLRDLEIAELMNMLSRKDKVNILLAKGVSGSVSVNLFDVTMDEAIHSIANAAGFAVEWRNGTYYILKQEDAGKNRDSGLTKIHAFKIQYTDPAIVEKILTKYLSRYGSLTVIPERKLIVVEDLPRFIDKIEKLLEEVDSRPQQIMIEAKILEVTLDDTEAFGLDWKRIFSEQGGAGNIGTNSLGSPGAPGFFFNFVHPKVEVFLDGLKARGRVRTLSTPKLLALENEEASVIIGDRIGYKVTTTINQVTTESIAFLESGVILKVRPSVDDSGRVMLDIHPEVSTGNVSNGIPSQTTTEVTTQLIVPNGQTIFIGGLMKNRLSESRDGIPILGDLPGVGRLFSNREKVSVNTETVVLITPYIVNQEQYPFTSEEESKVSVAEKDMIKKSKKIDAEIDFYLEDDDGEGFN